jgi:hypothetical protein
VPAAEGVRPVQADTAAKQHPDSHAHSFNFQHADPHRHTRFFHGDSHADHDAIRNPYVTGDAHAIHCQPHVICGDIGRAVVDRGDAADPGAHVPE